MISKQVRLQARQVIALQLLLSSKSCTDLDTLSFRVSTERLCLFVCWRGAWNTLVERAHLAYHWPRLGEQLKVVAGHFCVALQEYASHPKFWGCGRRF